MAGAKPKGVIDAPPNPDPEKLRQLFRSSKPKQDMVVAAPVGNLQDYVAGEVLPSMAQLMTEVVRRQGDKEALKIVLDAQEKALNRQAKMEWISAMIAFQKDTPAIQKEMRVERRGGEKMFDYASLPMMIEVVRKYMNRHGFTERFSFEDNLESVTELRPGQHITGHIFVSHIGGHTEQTSLTQRVPSAEELAKGSHKLDDGQRVRYVLNSMRRSLLDAAFGLTQVETEGNERTLPVRKVPPRGYKGDTENEFVKDVVVLTEEQVAQIEKAMETVGMTDADLDALLAEKSGGDWDKPWREAPSKGYDKIVSYVLGEDSAESGEGQS